MLYNTAILNLKLTWWISQMDYSIPNSMLGTVNYHFTNNKMRTWSWSANSIEPGQTAGYWVNYVTMIDVKWHFN